jgi:uncharacterized protein YciI
MRVFAVIRTRGLDWNASAPLEGQQQWKEHAVFMDALYANGFAVLVGPLEGTPDALLILRANSPEEIEARLKDDPWTINGLLRTTRIAPWTLRLGSLPV